MSTKKCLLTALAVVSCTLLPLAAFAVPGDVITTITVPVPTTSCCGVSIAVDCDGVLYYTNSFDPTLYKMDKTGALLGSVPIIDAATGAPLSIGALSWDGSSKMLWGGTDSYTTTCPPQGYLIDPATGLATYKFTVVSQTYCFVDGIAYDGNDNTVWISDDVSSAIDHFDASGVYLGSLTPLDAAGNVLGAISGVLVGTGNKLYLGRNGFGEIVRVDKTTGAFIDMFATVAGRDEDLECDVINFAPLTAVWSKDTYNNTVTAIEVESGTCACGGARTCDTICGWVADPRCDVKEICGLYGACVQAWTSYPGGDLIDTDTTDEFGHFCLDITPGHKYDIRIYKNGFCPQVITWTCERGPLYVDLDPLPFDPQPNWPFFADYYSTIATFEGNPIQPGDVILAQDPDGVWCGLYTVQNPGVYLIHVLGDDPLTPGDEGAKTGDIITLWLNCVCPDTAPDTWANFGSNRFDAAWDCRPTGLCCELCKGWNMWSYNILLPDYAREVVLATIDLNYDAVRSGLCDYGSISWFAGRPLNDLTDVTPWYGYDIHMLEDDTVCVEGRVIPPDTPIELCAGWNYIPYLPMKADLREHALASLDGNYIHIFTMYCGYGVASWNESRDPQNNDLVCLEPCHGYWILMKSDDTLIYPTDDYGCNGFAKLVANSPSGRVAATPMVCDFWASAAGSVSGLNAGDLLSVRTSSGILCGEATVGSDGAFLVHVYGDVPQTPEMEGAVDGEDLIFEVNGASATVVTGSPVWRDRQSVKLELTSSGAAAIPSSYALLQNYPNPFNAGTIIPFVLSDRSEWTLTIYNVVGQAIRTFDGVGAGMVRVEWDGASQDGASVSSGIYFYRVVTPRWTAVKEMTLLR